MGRGNFRTVGEYEGLYYLDYERVHSEDASDDFYYYTEEYEDMVINVRYALQARFKSFCEIDEWNNSYPYQRSDMRLILENELFQVGIVDNEWSLCGMPH